MEGDIIDRLTMLHERLVANRRASDMCETVDEARDIIYLQEQEIVRLKRCETALIDHVADLENRLENLRRHSEYLMGKLEDAEQYIGNPNQYRKQGGNDRAV